MIQPHPRRPSSVPAEVVVVGAGPVGLYAAVRLAGFGANVAVLERRPSPVKQGSKALCVQSDVLELLDNVGCGRALVERGRAWDVSRTFIRGREVVTTRFPASANGTPAFVNIPQWTTEALLLDRALASPAIEVFWSHNVVRVNQDDQEVLLEADTPMGRRGIRARYVLACDGTASQVRQQLGVRWLGRVHADRFLIADVKARLDWPAERRFWFDPPSNPGRQIVVHPQPDDLWRIDWQLPPDTDLARERESGRLDERIRRLVGDAHFSLDWVSTYRFHQRLAERLQVGRVSLLGDAAHALPPFGARGMNSGLQDAENLAWKLAAVLQGRASPCLVQTYHEERHLAGRANVAVTGRTIRFMVPPSRAHRAARDLLLRGALYLPPLRRRVNSGRMSEPADYGGCSAFPPTLRTERGGARPGTLVENLPVGRRTLREICASGFLCLVDGRAPGADRILEACQSRALSGKVEPLVVEAPGRARTGHCAEAAPEQLSALRGLLARARAEAILVRPDGYIAAVGRPGDALVALRDALEANHLGADSHGQRFSSAAAF